MRKILDIISIVFLAGFLITATAAEQKDKSSKESKSTTIHPDSAKLQVWTVDDMFASRIDAIPDTSSLNYQANDLPVYQRYISAEWLGNIGSPAQSAIFSQRQAVDLVGDYIFRNPYKAYYLATDEVRFYNTRLPYSNIQYQTGGYTNHGEDRLKGCFSMNANQRLNFGFCFDYIYGRGAFTNASTDLLNGAINGSYHGEKYSISFEAAINNARNFENGGLVNDSALYTMTDSRNVQVNMSNAWSQYKSYYFWVNQNYSVGYSTKDSSDSEIKHFVPVMTFGYTTKFEGSRKKYYEKSITTGYYANNYYSDKMSRDTTSNNLWRNILYIQLNEGFKKWAVFGIRAFVEADLEENMNMIADSAYHWKTQGLLSVGGEIYKRKGHTTYGALAKVLLLGSDKRLAFDVTGDFHTYIPMGKEKLTIDAEGHVKSTNPSYFTEHYYSNHFIWENSFSNIWSARGYGKIGIPNKYCDFEVGAGWQGLKNYIFFNKEALPEQSTNFIQIISGEAKVDLHLWWFNWENSAVIQYSSYKEELPLPLVSLYTNMYGRWKMFKKVLTCQFGVDCRYNTAYYANAYMPATGQFYLQDQVLVGNYPVMNLYLDLSIKKFKFFVTYYNFSALFMKPTYFTTPHNPLNPQMIKCGLSWSFYN